MGWVLQYTFPDCKVIRRVVAYVLDPDKLEAAPVCPENVIAYLSEDGSLPDFLPSLQVMKPAALSEVSYQVYETVLCKEVQHALAPRYPCFSKFQVQIPKDTVVPEALQVLLKVRQVFQHWGWQVRPNKQGPSEYGDYLVSYHIWHVVARGLNLPPVGALPHHHPNAALISPGTGRTRRQTSHAIANTIM